MIVVRPKGDVFISMIMGALQNCSENVLNVEFVWYRYRYREIVVVRKPF
jgi:hypothetical protein